MATVAIGGGLNAGLLAAQILVVEGGLAQKLEAYRSSLHDAVVAKDARLMQLGSTGLSRPDELHAVRVRSTLAFHAALAVLPAAIVYAVALSLERLRGHQFHQAGAEGLGPGLQGPSGGRFSLQRGLSALDGGGVYCLVCGVHPADPGPVVNRQFAFCGGGFSLWLCLDDMFLVHDRYLGEAFLYITYALFTGLLLVRFRGALRRFGGDTFLVLAVILLGSSVLIDAFQGLWPNSYETVQLFEEGFEISRDCCLARFLVPLRERRVQARLLLSTSPSSKQ